VVSFMLWSLHPQGRSPQYPLNRRLGGSQTHSECYGKEKKFHQCHHWQFNPFI